MSEVKFNILKSMPLAKLILLPLFMRQDLAVTYTFLNKFNKEL